MRSIWCGQKVKAQGWNLEKREGMIATNRQTDRQFYFIIQIHYAFQAETKTVTRNDNDDGDDDEYEYEFCLFQ